MKKIVKEVDKKVREHYEGMDYTSIDYEFAANIYIEGMELDNEIKEKLRVKFANKAIQLYYDRLNAEIIPQEVIERMFEEINGIEKEILYDEEEKVFGSSVPPDIIQDEELFIDSYDDIEDLLDEDLDFDELPSDELLDYDIDLSDEPPF